jgi:hypothetical protein
MRKLLVAGALLLVSSAANACGFMGQPPCFPQPMAPTTMQTSGNQTFITTPGRPPTTMQTFGNQTFINTPGRPPVTCQTFGNMTNCR